MKNPSTGAMAAGCGMWVWKWPEYHSVLCLTLNTLHSIAKVDTQGIGLVMRLQDSSSGIFAHPSVKFASTLESLDNNSSLDEFFRLVPFLFCFIAESSSEFSSELDEYSTSDIFTSLVHF